MFSVFDPSLGPKRQNKNPTITAKANTIIMIFFIFWIDRSTSFEVQSIFNYTLKGYNSAQHETNLSTYKVFEIDQKIF